MPRFAVIFPAAGSSTRFGASRSKLLADLLGMPVIARALLPFLQRTDTHYIFLAVPGGAQAPATSDALMLRDRAADIWETLKTIPEIAPRLGGQLNLVPGGANRAESVRAALRVVPKDIEWIAIHDAARPMVSQELIERTLAAAVEHGAAAPALPVALTVKRALGPLPAVVERTMPREELWALQTPQIMRREALLRAFDICPIPLEQVTDDLQLLELAGESTWLVPGDESNFKITTPQDLRIAELLLRR